MSDECSFCVALRGTLQGKRWDAVAAESLEEEAGSIPQLMPAAFIYYLPAFLLQAVAAPWIPGIGSSKALFHAVLSVCDPELPEDEWWRERLPLLNSAQRTAVATFVKWAARTLAGDEDEASLRTSAEVALRKYWGQYVSESLGAAQQGDEADER